MTPIPLQGPLTEPGAYFMSAQEYYSDPAPTPSLTQSIAKVLIEQSPAHARLAHPRLNPDYEDTTTRAQALGTAAHSLLIGRGKELFVIDAGGYQTKAAKEERDAALAACNTPVLISDYETALKMSHACLEQLQLIAGAERAFIAGDGEVVLAWREADLWLRSQADWIDWSQRIVWDYKTTGESAAPHMLARRIPDRGLDIQAAMYERGLTALLPDTIGRWRFRFVLQETEAPFALSVVELDNAAMTMGQKKLAMAVAIWRRCMTLNVWPAYPLAIVRPEYPMYAETQWLSREIAASEIVNTTMDPFYMAQAAAAQPRNNLVDPI